MKGNQFTNELSREIYEQTYRYGEETLEATQKRVAEDIASIEKDHQYWSEKFMSILEDFKFVPGGRIISNAGTKIKGTTYINCFVSGFQGENRDSMDGIMSELRRQAMILKSEGGYGICADTMRPKGGFISGIANETPGAVKMLDMWNTQSDVITAGSGNKSNRKDAKQKIRKGAQMVTMSCFSDDTLILTNEGWINIVDIIKRLKQGDIIMAIDDKGNENLITNPVIREPEPIYKIETEDGSSIEVTADHKFEVRNIKTNKIYLKSIKDVDLDLEELKIIQK